MKVLPNKTESSLYVFLNTEGIAKKNKFADYDECKKAVLRKYGKNLTTLLKRRNAYVVEDKPLGAI